MALCCARALAPSDLSSRLAGWSNHRERVGLPLRNIVYTPENGSIALQALAVPKRAIASMSDSITYSVHHCARNQHSSRCTHLCTLPCKVFIYMSKHVQNWLAPAQRVRVFTCHQKLRARRTPSALHPARLRRLKRQNTTRLRKMKQEAQPISGAVSPPAQHAPTPLHCCKGSRYAAPRCACSVRLSAQLAGGDDQVDADEQEHNDQASPACTKAGGVASAQARARDRAPLGASRVTAWHTQSLGAGCHIAAHHGHEDPR